MIVYVCSVLVQKLTFIYMLNHLNKNEYFDKLFLMVSDIVSIEADYENQYINYRVYNTTKYLYISVKELV